VRELKRSPSTISRELRRNTGENGAYFPGKAQRMALERRESVGPPLRVKGALIKTISNLLCLQWSPEQISGRLKLKGTTVSHEAIYRFVYKDRAEGGDLYLNLRRKRKMRRSQIAAKNLRKAGLRVNQAWIAERPSIVEKRVRLGDFERDTILGSKGGPILLSIVDRVSRLTKIGMLSKLSSEQTHRETIQLLKRMTVHTITNDNGPEFSLHKRTSITLKAPIFFNDPYSSWQRGTNENTNGLIRQYYPKGFNFTEVSSAQIKEIELRLNKRPRKCLGYKTPIEVHRELTRSGALSS
jgi:transposase, IS30 family